MALTDSDKLQLSQAFDKMLRSVGITENTLDFNSLTQALSSTTGAVNIYVDATLGNDKNVGTSTSPFATLQAAVDSLPKNISHAVTINMAAGNYSGADICGFTFGRPLDPNNGQYFMIKGTPITATLASGITSGTVTSFTNSTYGNSTVTVTGAGWTVNDLQDRFIEITGGTGATNFFPIVSNTATVLTLVNGITLDNSSTFIIRDSGTIVTNGNPTTVVPSNVVGGFTSVAANAATLTFQNNNASTFANPSFFIKFLKIVNTSSTIGRGVRVVKSDVRFFGCNMVTSASTTLQLTSGSSDIVCCTLTCNGNSASNTISAGSSGLIDIPSTLLISNSAIRNTSGNGIFISQIANLTVQVAYLKCNGPFLLGCPVAGRTSIIQNSRIDGGVIGIDLSAVTGSTGLTINVVDISNTTTALSVAGQHTVKLTGIVTGTTNTTGISLSKGANVQVSSTSTITGTTEVSVDGTATTLAAMRAASPKAISNPNFFSVIYE